MLQSIRPAARTAMRLARQQHITLSRRTFIVPTAIRQAELVQDMYLRELKSYKQPPVKPNDSEGHVQKFTMPKAPPSPEEGDIANDLKAYESQQVEVEGQSSSGAPPVEEDWFEEEEEDDAPAHH